MLKKLLCIMLCAVMLGMSVSAEVAVPQLKYKNAGAFKGWTEESYYCTPVFTDLEGDGRGEIVYSSYCIVVIDAATGEVKWRVNSGKDRSSSFKEIGGNDGFTWSDLEVVDINNDGRKEIVSIHGGGCISVLDSNGYFLPGFPVWPVRETLRSLCTEDLNGDGTREIIVGAGISSPKSVWVYSYDGNILPGWPQLDNMQNGETNPYDYKNNGWGYGVFDDGTSTGDIDGDGMPEIIVPTDTAFVGAYEADGKLCKANEALYGGRTWAKIPLYEDYATELRMENEGWGMPLSGNEKREELYHAESGHAGSEVCDVDGDGKNEVVITTIIGDRRYVEQGKTEYMTVFVLNGDRTRYQNTGFGYDWTNIPTDLGAPLVQDGIIVSSRVQCKPTVTDMDGDGHKEILFADYSGKLHCFSLDGTEHGAWPYSLTKRTSPAFEYATRPVCVHLDGDGSKEVIFASFYDKNQVLPSGQNGSLYILNSSGTLVHKISLPSAVEVCYNNGAMASPLVADIDADGRYEIVINTIYGAICAYDI